MIVKNFVIQNIKKSFSTKGISKSLVIIGGITKQFTLGVKINKSFTV